MSDPTLAIPLPSAPAPSLDPSVAGACSAFTRGVSPLELPRLSLLVWHELEALLDKALGHAMLPHYVARPRGLEHGHYLCVDLGGLTLRVAIVHLPGNSPSTLPLSDQVDQVLSRQALANHALSPQECPDSVPCEENVPTTTKKDALTTVEKDAPTITKKDAPTTLKRDNLSTPTPSRELDPFEVDAELCAFTVNRYKLHRPDTHKPATQILIEYLPNKPILTDFFSSLPVRAGVSSRKPLLDDHATASPPHSLPCSPTRSRDLDLSLPEYPIVVSETKWLIGNDRKVVDIDFFNSITDKIYHVLSSQSVIKLDSRIAAGVTWLFPLDNRSINSALILGMGKGYSLLPLLRGADLKTLLEKAMLERHNVMLDIRIVFNDSLAVLTAATYMDPLVTSALVLGTGLNMCFALAKDLVPLEKQLQVPDSYIIYNAEMSLFGHGLVQRLGTRFDTLIDPRMLAEKLPFVLYMLQDPVLHKYLQPMEQMAAGRYLTELVRLAVCDLAASKCFFAQVPAPHIEKLSQSPFDGVPGELMCFVLEHLDLLLIADEWCRFHKWPRECVLLQDARHLKLIVDSIVTRAAFVAASCIVATLRFLYAHNGPFDAPETSIGYVGLVLENLKSLHRQILAFVNECCVLRDIGVQVVFTPVPQSSIIGSAIGAACHL